MGADNNSLSFPNYQLIANSHDIKYFKVNKHMNLRNNIKRVLEYKGPCICELIMDSSQEQMPKAINRRDSQGKFIATTFEDMWPFLSKKEMSESTYDYYIKNLKKGD